MTSPLAAQPSQSRGRAHPEVDAAPRGPRDIFQRDRDRIVHSVSFRRLRHKTQVFVAPDGDHYRVRLTHSIEVAQIGRTVARVLGLNEDLTEALCLAHDLGHPPFGHAGEDALQDAMASAGGFDHNAHSIRLVTKLEAPYPGFDGLNLSWEALEGLAKHNGPIASADLGVVGGECGSSTWSSTAGLRWRRRSRRWPTISPTTIMTSTTGCRAGLLDLDELIEVPIVSAALGRDRAPPSRPLHRQEAAGAGARPDRHDGRRSDCRNPAEDRRSGGRQPRRRALGGQAAGRILLSAGGGGKGAQALPLHASLQCGRAGARKDGGSARRGRPFAAYRDDPSLLPVDWRTEEDEAQRLRTIGDFIAGMTDRFAVARHRELVGPVDLPDRF